MKRYVIILVLLIATISGCKKDSGYTDTIKITHPDQTVPPCAPAYWAVWQSPPRADSIVSISNTGPSIGLSSTTTFPVLMKINWKPNTPTCLGDITITGYQIIQ